ncbi:hypothetical protein SAMN05444166_6534 [Singulisphaera sp. GP187]|nr:hypothetical protein SAMN05444166_6534 [Singulisphaera sp. GP187]
MHKSTCNDTPDFAAVELVETQVAERMGAPDIAEQESLQGGEGAVTQACHDHEHEHEDPDRSQEHRGRKVFRVFEEHTKQTFGRLGIRHRSSFSVDRMWSMTR